MINFFAFNKWIAALESGKYKRTIGSLRNETGFCCLGVACDVFKKVKRKGKWLPADPCTGQIAFSTLGNPDHFIEDFLPREVREWLGVDEADPEIKGRTMSERNDSSGLSFKKVAAVLRTYVKDMRKKQAAGDSW